MDKAVLPADTHVGYVRLQVRDLARAAGFYRDLLGLREVKQEGETLFLAAAPAGPTLFVLVGNPQARPPVKRASGLFHTAVRHPSRRALARVVRHLAEARYPIGGASDHLVSEAIYLSDPEGNGVELYTDRPRATWPYQGDQVDMSTTRLDIEDLMAQLAGDIEPWTGADPGTDIGHVHLQVSDLARAEAFYHDLLGLDITQRSYPGALFFSAGGYHHHVGANIWNSRGASAQGPDTAGLLSWSLVMPDRPAWETAVARLAAAGVSAVAESDPAQGSLTGIMVRDYDGIGVELLTPQAMPDSAAAMPLGI